MLESVRLRASGLSGRLTASYILVTLVVVVLVETLVLGFQVLPLVNGTELQAQVDAFAKSYGQQLAQRYPRGGSDLGLQLGAVDQLGYLEAEHERLDQHHDGERDEDVGGDQPAR